MDFTQQLRFVHDALCTPRVACDDDQPETAFDEESDDVANENGRIDGNDTAAKRGASRDGRIRHELERRRAINRASATAFTVRYPHTRGAFATGVERHGALSRFAKNA